MKQTRKAALLLGRTSPTVQFLLSAKLSVKNPSSVSKTPRVLRFKEENLPIKQARKAALLLGRTSPTVQRLLSSKLSENNAVSLTVDGRKLETIASCRLFGFDLRSLPSGGDALLEKEYSKSNYPVAETLPSTLSVGVSEKKSELLRESEDQTVKAAVSRSKRGSKQIDFLKTKPHKGSKARSCGWSCSGLNNIKWYDELIAELEEMSEIKGELHEINGKLYSQIMKRI